MDLAEGTPYLLTGVALTGQRLLPAIEREDGTIIREESKDLAERVRDGRLDSQ